MPICRVPFLIKGFTGINPLEAEGAGDCVGGRPFDAEAEVLTTVPYLGDSRMVKSTVEREEILKTTRRTFLLVTLPGAALAAVAARTASAQAARLEESDPAAVALGYKHDAAKVDAAKHPTFAVSRNCANCQLYQAKAGEAWAACGAVGGKLVNAKGWCVAWVKKA